MENRFKFRYFSKRYNEMCNVDKIDFENKFLNFEYANGSIETLISTDTGILMQCTGLKDKNGKLIYEGDIIKRDSEMLQQYIINWNKKGFWCADDNALAFAQTTISTEYEVIGNIYENADLLKEDE